MVRARTRPRGSLSPPPAMDEGEEVSLLSLPPRNSLNERSKRRRLILVFTVVGFTIILLTTITIIAIREGRNPNPNSSSPENRGPSSDGSSVSSMGKSVASNRTEAVSYGPTLYRYEIVRRYPHDPTAFTQGLLYYGNDILYESTGMYGESTVREVNLTSGQVIKKTKCANSIFGEGLALWKDQLLQVTWQTKLGFIYDRVSLNKVGTFTHSMGDGWGLTSNASLLLGSDGSSSLFSLHPKTYQVLTKKEVKDGSRAVKYLNELELVDNKVLANIWQTECIAQISLQSGQVTSWILLHGLRAIAQGKANGKQMDVLNGIAFDKKRRRLFVTGKYWPLLFEVKLKKMQNVTSKQISDARKRCIM